MNRTLGILILIGATLVSASPAWSRGLLHKASFIQEWRRYPSPNAILDKFHAQFPNAALSSLSEACRKLNNENRPLLGDAEPATGQPTVDRPNSTFANWYNNCLIEFIKSENDHSPVYKTVSTQNPDGTTTYKDISTRQDFADAFGERVTVEIWDAVPKLFPSNHIQPSDYPTYARTRPWKDLSAGAKQGLVEKVLERMMGPPEILEDLDIGSVQEVEAKLINEVDRYAEKPDDRFQFLFPGMDMAQYGVSVPNASEILEFYIGLLDTLKY